MRGGGNIVQLAGWLEAATVTDGYSRFASPGQDLERARNHLELAELFYTREFPGVDLSLGKKVPAAIGLSTIYRPADRIPVQDLNDPSAPKSLGLWQAEASSSFHGVSVRALWLPVFVPSKFPSPRSRWAGRAEASDTGELDFNFVQREGQSIENRYPTRFFPDSRGLLRVKTTVRGWDLFGSGFYGPSPTGVLKAADGGGAQSLQALLAGAPASMIKEHVPVWHVGAGFSTTIKKLELHGESLLQTSPQGKDDDYASSVAGWTYTVDELPFGLKSLLESVGVTGEYAWENLLRAQSHPAYAQSSRRARGGKDTYLGRFDIKFNEKWRIAAAFVYDHNDGGLMEGLALEYRIRAGLKLRSGLELYGGPRESVMGRWAKNDRVANQLEYSF